MSKTLELRGWSFTFFVGPNRTQCVQIYAHSTDWKERVDVVMPLREFRELAEMSEEEITRRLSSMPGKDG